jgi:hypothetical protein
MGSSDSGPGRSREPRAGWASSWHPYRSCALLRYRLSGAASFSAERPIRLGRSSPAPRPARNSLAGDGALQRNATCSSLARMGSHLESGLAVQRGIRIAKYPRGIDLRPSCRPPTGRCVGRTYSLRSLRDAKARSVNGPLRRCRREPGHLLLLVSALGVRAQRTRIGTVPVQRMPMPVFLPHGRKDGTPDREVVRADGRGQGS